MSYVIVQHKVEDFPKWKAVFDAQEGLRRANGELSARIFHDAADPNALTLFFEWDALENAHQYAQNPELKAAMMEAGVAGPPTFYFLTED